MSNIPLGFPVGLLNTDNSPLDAKYGAIGLAWAPYATVAAAKAAIPSGARHIGLTVNVAGVEYWWKDGILDANLVIKTGGSSVIVTTYAALSALKAASGLVPGAIYKYDFQTIHRIEDTAVINTGPVESILVRATEVNKLDRNIFSITWPQDIIEYDFDSALAEDGVTPRPGKITYRRDTVKNITLFYDWRAVKFRVWTGALFHNTAVKDSSSQVSVTITQGQAVDAPATRYREYYIDFTAFLVHDATPTIVVTKGANVVTKTLCKVGGAALAANELDTLLGASNFGRIFYSVSLDQYVVVDNQTESDMCNWRLSLQSTDHNAGNGTRIRIPDSNDFQDVLTFAAADPAAKDFYMGRRGDGLPNRIVFLTNGSQANVIFDTNCKNTIFRNGNLVDVRIGSDMLNCRFGGSVQFGRIGTECQNILALCTTSGRMSFCTGSYASDPFSTNVSIFNTTNWFNASADKIQNTTMRLRVQSSDHHFGRVTNCTINFTQTTPQANGIILNGTVFNKHWEDGSTISSSYMMWGDDQAEKSFPANTDFQDNTAFRNPTLSIGIGMVAGNHRIKFWNSVAQSHLNWNPTAARELTLPDESGKLGIFYEDIAVSKADILALNATPKILLAAPGVNKYIQPLRIGYYWDFNGAAYIATDLIIEYGGAGTVDLYTETTPNTAFENAADEVLIEAINLLTTGQPAAEIINQPIQLKTTVAVLDAGGLALGTMKIRIVYSIVNIA